MKKRSLGLFALAAIFSTQGFSKVSAELINLFQGRNMNITNTVKCLGLILSIVCSYNVLAMDNKELKNAAQEARIISRKLRGYHRKQKEQKNARMIAGAQSSPFTALKLCELQRDLEERQVTPAPDDGTPLAKVMSMDKKLCEEIEGYFSEISRFLK